MKSGFFSKLLKNKHFVRTLHFWSEKGKPLWGQDLAVPGRHCSQTYPQILWIVRDSPRLARDMLPR